MSAAVEGALEGIPSVGFSLDEFDPNADFTLAKHVVRHVIENALEDGLPNGVCLNVNIPYVLHADFKGIKVCRQAHAYWDDRFEKREDQFGRTYYWLTGDFNQHEPGKDTDLFYLSQNYATIVPTQFDLTAHETLTQLNEQFSKDEN
jgi:5'-nucleotidase